MTVKQHVMFGAGRWAALALLPSLWLASAPCFAAPSSAPKPARAQSAMFTPQVKQPSPQEIISSVNTGGPEVWPLSRSLSTQLTVPAGASTGAGGVELSGSVSPESQPAAPSPKNDTAAAGSAETVMTVPAAEEKKPAQAKPPVIYVDEKGNPVPKPPEPKKMLEEAGKLVEDRKYEEAVPLLEQVKALQLPPELREQALYLYSDAISGQFADKPMAGFDLVSAAANEAMNANLRSPHVPDILFRLGMINLDVGNLVEAEGYFKAMLRRFPAKVTAAQGFRLLGDALLAQRQQARAESMYRTVINNYPESPAVKEASVGLCRTLSAQGKLKEAAQIMDFVNLRWARYYLEDPSFLKDEVALARHRGALAKALEQSWLFYNLKPDDAGNAAMLAEMGDMYFQMGRSTPALELFKEIRQRYPKTESAAVAQLRLAEGGVYDGPTITLAQMTPVLARNGEPKPQAVYRDLMQAYPRAPFGQLAQLKLAMWQFSSRQYAEAMGTAAEFMDAHPEHPAVPEAKNLAWEAFLKEKALALQERNYGRLLILWEGFPLVRERYGKLDAELRYALAQGMLERGDHQEGFAMLGEFLKSPKDPVYGEAAFVQFFNHYLQKSDWNAVLDLGDLVSGWKLEADLRRQVDYALALAAENLGLTQRALEQWKMLAKRADIPLYQQAYAHYFLARDAERRRDIKAAYDLNKKVLELFTRLQEERSDRAEPARIREAMAALMDITEVSNRIPESLEWVDKYREFVTEKSPEYGPLRFREARLHRKLGDDAGARAILEDIVKREPESSFGKAAASELRTLEVSRDLRNFMPEEKAGGAASGK